MGDSFFAHSRRGKMGLDEINGQSNRSHGDDQPEVACRPRTKKTTSPLPLRSHLFLVNLMDQVWSSHQTSWSKPEHFVRCSEFFRAFSRFPADSQQIHPYSSYIILPFPIHFHHRRPRSQLHRDAITAGCPGDRGIRREGVRRLRGRVRSLGGEARRTVLRKVTISGIGDLY